jgi:hypothetical protein
MPPAPSSYFIEYWSRALNLSLDGASVHDMFLTRMGPIPIVGPELCHDNVGQSAYILFLPLEGMLACA